jgi:hypothetical protein
MRRSREERRAARLAGVDRFGQPLPRAEGSNPRAQRRGSSSPSTSPATSAVSPAAPAAADDARRAPARGRRRDVAAPAAASAGPVELAELAELPPAHELAAQDTDSPSGRPGGGGGAAPAPSVPPGELGP